VYTARMKRLIVLLQVVTSVSASVPVPRPADSVVNALYQQVVLRKPLGIPKGADKAAIWPLVSKRLAQNLATAQSCEDDYFRQHAGDDGKPQFEWLESDLFSGANEEASPSSFAVEHTEPQADGTFRVSVRLTYRDSSETYGKPTTPSKPFEWHVAVVVKSESGRYVVDDVVLFEDDSTKIASRLSASFAGCDGPRWVGMNESETAPAKITYENALMGEMRDEDGVHLVFTDVKASDGNYLTVLYQDFNSPADAQAFFEKQLAKAAKVVDRKNKLSPDGTFVGERAEILLGLSSGGAIPAVLWTDGVKFHEISSTSRDSVLELERVYPY
jgi:hypothetical protein